jgi:hypothetical protein
MNESRLDNFVLALYWLFPITLVLHVTEEYWGGVALAPSRAQMKGVSLSPSQFLISTALGLVLMVLGLLLAKRYGFPQMFLVILGTIVLINGFTHTIYALRTMAYNPGLVSGVIIWIPLGILTLTRLWGKMLPRRYWVGMAIGLGVHGIVSLVALGGVGALVALIR